MINKLIKIIKSKIILEYLRTVKAEKEQEKIGRNMSRHHFIKFLNQEILKLELENK